jgi:signal transduction histidine kinase
MKRRFRYNESGIAMRWNRFRGKASPLLAYTVAVVLAVAGVYARVLLNPTFGREAPFLPSLIAIALSALYGGLGPGLVATVVTSLSAAALFAESWGLLSHQMAPVPPVRLWNFFLTGTLVSFVTGELRRTTYKWRRAEETAEQAREFAVLQERNRLAREIHDTLAQGFTGIVIQLEAAEDSLADAPDEARAHIFRARTLARESLAEARRSVQALRPHLLEQRDLGFALRYYVEQMTAGTAVQAEVIVEGTPPDTGIAEETEGHLLRIGLEALTNTLKHANARHVQVRLSFLPNEVRLAVKDDGCGFEVGAYPSGQTDGSGEGTHLGFGLAAMRERAQRIGGKLIVESRRGKGSEVTVVVPVNRQMSAFAEKVGRVNEGK